MHKVFIMREPSTDHGTMGMLGSTSNFFCNTLEPPDRDNAPNYSRIPAGTYLVKPRWSAKYQTHYWVTEVEGRSFILVHSGNLAGDRFKDLITHSWGCLLLGARRGWLNAQRAVLNSRPTVRSFKQSLGMQPFELIIGGV